MELFRGGAQALTASLECTDQNQLLVDPLLVTTLQQKAIHDRLSSHQLAPLRELTQPQIVAKRQRIEGGFREDPDDAAELARMLTKAEFERMDLSIVMGEEDGGKDGSSRESSGSSSMCRKEKNRIAAARSNLKRKWRNKVLRLNIVILRQRIAELREVETKLRCEQMWLKQRCHLELPAEKISAVEMLM